MKSLPLFLSILVLSLILVNTVDANTSINISNNGAGSNTSIKVNSSTGGNYINGQEVSGSNGNSKTTVKVNGETLVDETSEGGQDVNISVKKEGDKPAEVNYEVNKKEKVVEVKGSAVVKKDSENKVDVKKEVRDVTINKSKDRVRVNEESLFIRLEAFFTKLRDIFSSR